MIKSLLSNRDGNFAIMFALILLPLVLAAGSAVDLTNALSVKTRLQGDLDAAILASAHDFATGNEATIRTALLQYLNADKPLGVTYTINSSDIQIDMSGATITANVATDVPTSFMQIVSVDTIPVSAQASVTGPSTSYMEISIVIDKSASMLLSADSTGQAAMQASQAKCVFACHVVEGGPWTYQGKSYTTNYALSKAMGITLRSDLAVTAAKKVIDAVNSADPDHTRIKVGLYTLGTVATRVLAPTLNTAAAVTTLNDDSKGLNSATSEDSSRFDSSIASLATMVGDGGDGTSSATPLKLALIVTDGITSERDWVLNGVWWDGQGAMHGGTDWAKVAPLNPSWCSSLKARNTTVGLLYTEYLAIPTDGGYINTVGSTMASAFWKSTWGGVIRSSVSTSTSRRDYISDALQDCASTSDLFLSANQPTSIEQGLVNLLAAYMKKIRLTS